jgi:hypothetical protein
VTRSTIGRSPAMCRTVNSLISIRRYLACSGSSIAMNDRVLRRRTSWAAEVGG